MRTIIEVPLAASVCADPTISEGRAYFIGVDGQQLHWSGVKRAVRSSFSSDETPGDPSLWFIDSSGSIDFGAP